MIICHTSTGPQTCRWATPTMFLNWPFWLDAGSWPWSCALDRRLRLLSNGDYCQGCARWERRQPGETPPDFEAGARILKDDGASGTDAS